MVAEVRGVCVCRGVEWGEKGRKNEQRLVRRCLGNGEQGPR